ncbi:HIT family protein [Epibacterium ulvae]|uniref:HIT family protein n=1 Tax=Epibacterium ulvae TaxID=1156985 RepID=UPI002490C860|nr:HIT family protein [Epibacterium ulvae]
MCVFCKIVSGDEPSSIIHQDEHCIAFMNIRPIYPGEFMVIPRLHIDHFTDLPDPLAAHILLAAQRIARRLKTLEKPIRIGYVVHGFGVAHAHLNVVPLHTPHDILSSKHLQVANGKIEINEKNLLRPARHELDAMAERLSFQ